MLYHQIGKPLMKHSYIIIDDDQNSTLRTKAIADGFQDLHYIASAHNYDSGLDLILEHNPKIVFLEIDPANAASNLSLQLVNELYRYLTTMPTVIVTTLNRDLAFEAIKYEVFDYIIKPVNSSNLRKAILKWEKAQNISRQIVDSLVAPMVPDVASNEQLLPVSQLEDGDQSVVEAKLTTELEKTPLVELESEDLSENVEALNDLNEDFSKELIKSKEERPLIICVKSYGDYRFIEAKDICYLQADNNSTDIHLYNGEMITAFKTLKHFEGVLSSPFVRIHNSYIVNIDYVSRIHTGNSVCYIKNTTIKLPFSKSYKENVDSIINSITTGNYLEI